MFEYLQIKDAVMRSNYVKSWDDKTPTFNPSLKIRNLVTCLTHDLENGSKESKEAVYQVIIKDMAKSLAE